MEDNHQWQIQDFPDGMAPTPEVMATYLATFLLKIAWKLKILDQGGVRPNAPSLYLPMFIDHATPETQLKQNYIKILTIYVNFIDTEAKSSYLRSKIVGFIFVFCFLFAVLSDSMVMRRLLSTSNINMKCQMSF